MRALARGRFSLDHWAFDRRCDLVALRFFASRMLNSYRSSDWCGRRSRFWCGRHSNLADRPVTSLPEDPRRVLCRPDLDASALHRHRLQPRVRRLDIERRASNLHDRVACDDPEPLGGFEVSHLDMDLPSTSRTISSGALPTRSNWAAPTGLTSPRVISPDGTRT